jgi:hypothetical protein
MSRASRSTARRCARAVRQRKRVLDGPLPSDLHGFATSTHPRVFARADQRAALLEKIGTSAWAQKTYEGLKNQVDQLVERHATDPEWIVSRLQMHWDEGARFTDFHTQGGPGPVARREGDAPHPTVRVSHGGPGPTTLFPGKIPLDRIEPYGNGDLWHQKDGVWTFIRGASYQRQLDPEDLSNRFWLGYLCYETIGDTRRYATVPLTYDFIHDYLGDDYFESAAFRDGIPGERWAPPQPGGKAWARERLVAMFQKYIDNKILRGSGARCNWNLIEQEGERRWIAGPGGAVSAWRRLAVSRQPSRSRGTARWDGRGSSTLLRRGAEANGLRLSHLKRTGKRRGRDDTLSP